MTEEVKTACKEVLSEIRSFDFTRPQDTALFESAQKIISNIGFLVGAEKDAEVNYYIEIDKNREAGLSVAAAEAKAKTTEHYKDWQKIKRTIEIGLEQINILKKFKDLP